jgi:endonuclease/exonuclease/phosphatase family metal-dependent hydrolase
MSQFNVMSYNVCTTITTYGTHLDIENRFPQIFKVIDTNKADILNIQEIRTKEAVTFERELSTRGYQVISFPVNDTALAATLITAFNTKVFSFVSKDCVWFKDSDVRTSGGNNWYPWGRILTFTTLKHIETGEEYTVLNTHFGLKKDEKTFSIQCALKEFEAIKDKKIIWCGDFNFFLDDGGDDHRKLITDYGFYDTVQKKLTDQNGNKMSGSFVGYSEEYDKFAPKSLDNLSYLDGIFSLNCQTSLSKCYVDIELDCELTHRNEGASDHFALITTVTI